MAYLIGLDQLNQAEVEETDRGSKKKLLTGVTLFLFFFFFFFFFSYWLEEVVANSGPPCHYSE